MDTTCQDFTHPNSFVLKNTTGHLFILNMFVLPPITLPSAASGVIMRLLFSLRKTDTGGAGHSFLEVRSNERNESVKGSGLVLSSIP